MQKINYHQHTSKKPWDVLISIYEMVIQSRDTALTQFGAYAFGQNQLRSDFQPLSRTVENNYRRHVESSTAELLEAAYTKPSPADHSTYHPGTCILPPAADTMFFNHFPDTIANWRRSDLDTTGGFLEVCGLASDSGTRPVKGDP
jgi:hypothetical protein